MAIRSADFFTDDDFGEVLPIGELLQRARACGFPAIRPLGRGPLL